MHFVLKIKIILLLSLFWLSDLFTVPKIESFDNYPYIVLIPNSQTTSIFDAGLFFINDNDTIFDIGANRGSFTREVLKKLGGGAKTHMYLFEPSPEVFKRLKNMTWPINVHCFELALSNQMGTAAFATNDGDALGSLVVRGSNDAINVATDTIDHFCSVNHIAKVNFIKIDAEGMDAHIIFGAKDMLKDGKIDFIQFEYGEGLYQLANIKFADLHAFLRQHRYYLFRIHGGGLIPQLSAQSSVKFCDFLAIHAEKMHLLPDVDLIKWLFSLSQD